MHLMLISCRYTEHDAGAGMKYNDFEGKKKISSLILSSRGRELLSVAFETYSRDRLKDFCFDGDFCFTGESRILCLCLISHQFCFGFKYLTSSSGRRF